MGSRSSSKCKGQISDEHPKFNLRDLEEKGRLHFFYHAPCSNLPVRDLLNYQGAGFKTEPYIERNAENYRKKCNQRNIQGLLKSSESYLFLFTKCKNEMREHKGKMYIVGYIVKENYLDRGCFYAVTGKTRLYSFDDAYPLRDLTSARNPRHVPKILSLGQTHRVLDAFAGKKDILKDCLKEIARLKKQLPRKQTRCR